MLLRHVCFSSFRNVLVIFLLAFILLLIVITTNARPLLVKVQFPVCLGFAAIPFHLFVLRFRRTFSTPPELLPFLRNHCVKLTCKVPDFLKFFTSTLTPVTIGLFGTPHLSTAELLCCSLFSHSRSFGLLSRFFSHVSF